MTVKSMQGGIFAMMETVRNPDLQGKCTYPNLPVIRLYGASDTQPCKRDRHVYTPVSVSWF